MFSSPVVAQSNTVVSSPSMNGALNVNAANNNHTGLGQTGQSATGNLKMDSSMGQMTPMAPLALSQSMDSVNTASNEEEEDTPPSAPDLEARFDTIAQSMKHGMGMERREFNCALESFKGAILDPPMVDVLRRLIRWM
uniref:Uncharacterized protein n=1 Tax=Anopheles coluzzii TaxID=1518534 RepID=A0A8W7PMH2_ANOCL